jgi:phenylalanyl-tRNA synthetase alpha chain
MGEKLEQLKQEALQEIVEATTLAMLQEVKVKYLGKKGPITEVSRGLATLSVEERPLVGQAINLLKDELEASITTKEKLLKKEQVERQLQAENIDVTLPGKPIYQANAHPLSGIIAEIEDIFIGMGFEVAEGPEVESDFYNFEALNLPKDHPARAMQDSFYITEEILLRTHTSPVQIRSMLAHKGQGPVKIICPGAVYRRDDDDATHSHQFTQIECLVVDKQIAMSDLKGLLLSFAQEMFGSETQIRLRPSFFPFTEPSVEVDVSCFFCHGEGCNICKQTGWIEILGAGIVHPNVLENAGFDSTEYTGLALGLGVERVAMLKYGIEDIRHFYTNDLRFLEQFRII